MSDTLYQIQTACGSNPSNNVIGIAGPQNAVLTVWPNAADPTQLWYQIPYSSGGVSGVKLQNSSNQLFLYYKGTDQALQMAADPGDTTVVWVWDYNQTLQAPNGTTYSYGALQSQANNSQNVNVFGGCPPGAFDAQVYSWSWNGGQLNEIWAFVEVPTP